MQNQLKNVPLVKLLPPPTQLRPVVETSVEFMELCDSIRDRGILNSILVRNHPTREGFFQVIDGMWRFSACRVVGALEIPCILKEGITDDDVLLLQIQTNAISYETRPIEFAEQMQKIISLRENVGAPMTLDELGKLVGKSTTWVKTRLKLLKLAPYAKRLVREGKLGLGKAVALVVLRTNEQDEFLAKWELRKRKKLTTREFELEVGRFRNEQHLAASEKRDAYHLSPLRPRLQTMDTLLIELDTMETASRIILKNNAQTALEGARLMLEWVLNLHEEERERRVRLKKERLHLRERLELIRRQAYDELNELES